MIRVRPFSIGLAMAFSAVPAALAHGTAPPVGEETWWVWKEINPWILLNLGLLGVGYFVGLRRLRAQRREDAPVRGGQVAAFSAGLACLFAALVGPIDVIALELQWVHMVQHMVLMNVAAPLVVLGAPVRTLLWLLPRAWRQQVGRGKRGLERRGIPRYLLWQPVLLWAIYAAVLWIWHLPRFYEAALQTGWIHDGQHVMFFAAACLFWRVLFDPIGRLRLSRAAAVVYLFATSLHATVLGVFMALAPRLWYPTYGDRTPAWGLAALEDQQLAGYIMWMPACMIYAVVAATVFTRWLRDETGGRNQAESHANAQ